MKNMIVESSTDRDGKSARVLESSNYNSDEEMFPRFT